MVNMFFHLHFRKINLSECISYLLLDVLDWRKIGAAQIGDFMSQLKQFEMFSCRADKCTGSCCHGWSIAVDNSALDTFRQCDMMEYVMEKNPGVYFLKQDDFGTCVQLKNGLCTAYQKGGAALQTIRCRQFPRIITESRQSLDLSCPTVAEMMLLTYSPELVDLHAPEWFSTRPAAGEALPTFDNLKPLMEAFLAILNNIFHELIPGVRDTDFHDRLVNLSKDFPKITPLQAWDFQMHLVAPWLDTHPTYSQRFLTMEWFNNDGIALPAVYMRLVLLRIFTGLVFRHKDEITDDDMINATYYFTRRISHDKSCVLALENMASLLDSQSYIDILCGMSQLSIPDHPQ